MKRVGLLFILSVFCFTCDDDEVACAFTFNKILYRATNVDCSMFMSYQGANIYNGSLFRLEISTEAGQPTTVRFFPREGSAYYSYTGPGVQMHNGTIQFDFMMESQGSPIGRLKGVCVCTSMVVE